MKFPALLTTFVLFAFALVPVQGAEELGCAVTTHSNLTQSEACLELADPFQATVIVVASDPHDHGGTEVCDPLGACVADAITDHSVHVVDAYISTIDVRWDLNNICIRAACVNVEDLYYCLAVESPIPCPQQPDEGTVLTLGLYDLDGDGDFEGIAVPAPGDPWVGHDFGCWSLDLDAPSAACPL